MLYYLSNLDYRNNLSLESSTTFVNSDEKVKSYLMATTIPDDKNVDIRAFSIVESITKEINDQKQKHEEYVKLYNEYISKKTSLSKEEIANAEKDGTLVRPEKVKVYKGVLIADDVPNYLNHGLITYFRKNNIDIYFIYKYRKKGISGFKQVDEFGLLETKETFEGDEITTIIKMF